VWHPMSSLIARRASLDMRWGGKSCLAERLNLKSQIAQRQRKRPGRLATEASSICEDGRSLRQFRRFAPLLRPILPTPK
jgi:hypothetical protein